MNDDEKSKVLPTRHSDSRPDGGAMGSAVERQMRASVVDTNSFTTRFNTNADGSVTRLRTRGGMCEYVTEQLPTSAPERSPVKAYMESGQLEYTWPGEGNPTRSYSAKWHFLDINPSGDYLGYIRYQNPSDIGTQDNDPALSESMDSLAVGYPKKTTVPADDASREAYANATIAKKIMMSMFPASLYSGKMRSFMQALYGAKEDKSSPLTLKVAGSSFVLTYVRTEIELTLGLWAHNSPGIFTAVDINGDTSFWLLSVTTTQFTAYPIKQDEAGKELLKTYNSSAITDRTKLEAYIFAHSFIALTDGKTYPISGMPTGGPLAYGWKFNSTGSKASIVLHEQVGGYGSLKWRAWECHLNFSFSDGVFSATTAATNYGYWTDGWGAFNIFAPEADIATRLECVSIAMAPGVAPAFNFSGVHVYGYYIDDIWEPVVLSRTVATYAEGSRPWTLDYSGLVLPSWADPDNDISAWEDGHYEGMDQWEVHTEYKRNTTQMTVEFDGFSFSGERKYVDSYDLVNTYANPTYYGSTQDWFISQFGTGPACEYTTESATTFLNTPCGTYSSCPDQNGNYFNYLTNYVYQCVRTMVAETATKYDERAWTLVIPGLDAESAYITTYTHQQFDAYSKTTTVSGTHFGAYQHVVGISGTGAMDVTVYTSTMTWYPEAWVASTETTTTPPSVPFVIESKAFNTEVHGVACDDPISPSMLFYVDKTYPYYDPGMFFFTSYGGRYIGSEGIKSPNSVRSQDRFVGWA